MNKIAKQLGVVAFGSAMFIVGYGLGRKVWEVDSTNPEVSDDFEDDFFDDDIDADFDSQDSYLNLCNGYTHSELGQDDEERSDGLSAQSGYEDLSGSVVNKAVGVPFDEPVYSSSASTITDEELDTFKLINDHTREEVIAILVEHNEEYTEESLKAKSDGELTQLFADYTVSTRG